MPNSPGNEREIVGKRIPAVERLGHAAAEDVGDLPYLFGGMPRSRADKHGHLLPRVEHLRGAAQVLILRDQAREGRESPTGKDRAVLARGLLVIGLSHVVRHDDAGNRTGRLGDADGTVDQVPRLLRDHADLDVLVRHVLEQVGEIHLLHVVASERHARLLADDGHHGPVVEFGVVEPVQEVDGPGAGGGHAHPHLVGELGVSSGREGR